MNNPRFKAIAFDLDGTLYPNHRFYLRLVPFLFKEGAYLRVFGKARDRLRGEARALEEAAAKAGAKKANPEKDASALLDAGAGEKSFYRKQAEYMAQILKADPETIEKKTEQLIYRGWEPMFKHVKLFARARETIAAFRENGLKTALLSDFPLGAKIENLGLSGLWDAVLCSEETGRLKPDPRPFRELIRAMDCRPDEILYVGNSFRYDVTGAQNAGLKAAWIMPKRMYVFPDNKKERKADFAFFDYRQLRDFVLT